MNQLSRNNKGGSFLLIKVGTGLYHLFVLFLSVFSPRLHPLFVLYLFVFSPRLRHIFVLHLFVLSPRLHASCSYSEPVCSYLLRGPYLLRACPACPLRVSYCSEPALLIPDQSTLPSQSLSALYLIRACLPVPAQSIAHTQSLSACQLRASYYLRACLFTPD